MNSSEPTVLVGRVASLHLHPETPGAPLNDVSMFEVVAGKGIQDEPRYFGRPRLNSGEPYRRQLTLIAREQIADHAQALSLAGIPPGAVRSNIETTGLNLNSWIGRDVRVGEAVVRFYAPRTPCAKMDAICAGLRALMGDGRQGVLAEIVRSGAIQVGDPIELI